MAAPDLPACPTDGERILCVVGPTASGKTGLVAKLAREIPIEVISLDSRQIYADLKVGTAQPTAEELETCPHHLINFIGIDETYDASRFRQDFQRVYLDIRQRGKVPLVAGGAGLYLKAIQEGFMQLPAGGNDNLAEIRSRVESYSKEELISQLGAVDPASLARLHPHDTYRQRRALEIFLQSGSTMTELIAQQKPDPCLGLNFKVAVLELPVATLDQRIKTRVTSMLKGGWLEETEVAMTKYGPDAPGLKSIGYPQVIEFLEDKLTYQDLTSTIFNKTRQYAKRQRTWFRKIPSVLRGSPCDSHFFAMLKNEI